MAPFFPSLGRLTLTPIPPSLVSTSEFARSDWPSFPGIWPGFDGDKESVAKDDKVDAALWTATALKQSQERDSLQRGSNIRGPGSGFAGV